MALRVDPSASHHVGGASAAREVAMYVRNVIAAEKPNASPPTRTLVLRQMDSLGLTMGGLARNRWIIDGEPESRTPSAPVDTSVRDRLRLVSNG